MTDTPSRRPLEPTAPEPAAPLAPVADSGRPITHAEADTGRPDLPEQAAPRGRATQQTPRPPRPQPTGGGWAPAATFTAPVPGWEWSGSWVPKPGVIALRPLRFGELLGASYAVLRRHWRVVLLLSGCIALVTQAAVSIASGFGIDNSATITIPSASTSDTAQLMHQEVELLRSLFPVVAITLPITVFTAVLGGALIAPVVSRAVIGRSAALAEVWPEIRPRLPQALGLAAVVTVALSAVAAAFLAPAVAADLAGSSDSTVLSLALLSLPGGLVVLWLYISLNLAGPALALERQTLRSAMSRSLRLVRRAWWRVFALTLLVTLLVDIAAGMLLSPTVIADLAMNNSDSTSTAGLLLTAVVGVLSSTLTIPITSAFAVLLYIDQRIRREALDLELAAAAGVPQYGH